MSKKAILILLPAIAAASALAFIGCKERTYNAASSKSDGNKADSNKSAAQVLLSQFGFFSEAFANPYEVKAWHADISTLDAKSYGVPKCRLSNLSLVKLGPNHFFLEVGGAVFKEATKEGNVARKFFNFSKVIFLKDPSHSFAFSTAYRFVSEDIPKGKTQGDFLTEYGFENVNSDRFENVRFDVGSIGGQRTVSCNYDKPGGGSSSYQLKDGLEDVTKAGR